MANLARTLSSSPPSSASFLSSIRNDDQGNDNDNGTTSSAIISSCYQDLGLISPANTPSDESRRVLLPATFEPGGWDVICQRGKDYHHHAGNQRLKICVEQQLKTYLKASTRRGKTEVITSIVRIVRRNSSSGSSGFVMQDPKTKRWYQVSHKVARDKVGNVLRDAAKMIRRVGDWQQHQRPCSYKQQPGSGIMHQDHRAGMGLMSSGHMRSHWPTISSTSALSSSSTMIPASLSTTVDVRSPNSNNGPLQINGNDDVASIQSRAPTTTAWVRQQSYAQHHEGGKFLNVTFNDTSRSFNYDSSGTGNTPQWTMRPQVATVPPSSSSMGWVSMKIQSNNRNRYSNIARTTSNFDAMGWREYDHHVVGNDDDDDDGGGDVLVDLDTSGLEQVNQGGIASFLDAPLGDFDF